MGQRKYKTIIELVMEANDSSEALDIAGEYLRGNIESGVSIKCYSQPLQKETVLNKYRNLAEIN